MSMKSYADTRIIGVTEIQGLNLTVRAKNGSFTVTRDVMSYLINASSSDVTVTLPSTEDKLIEFRVYSFTKTDSSTNKITLDPFESEKINGELTLEFDVQYTAITISSDGSQWFIL